MLENEEMVEDVLADDEKVDVEKPKKKTKKDEIETLKIENAELKDKVLRIYAELENYKKRTNEERIKERKYASVNIITDLITPLEYLKVACNMQTDDEQLKNFLIGFKMISDQLFQVLESDGLKEIKAVGEKFDPNYHHAIETQSNDEYENDVILSERQKGYTYKERVIRPSMVIVNKKEND